MTNPPQTTREATDRMEAGMSGLDAAFGDFRRQMRAEMTELADARFRALEEQLDSKIDQRLGNGGGPDGADAAMAELVEDEGEIERIILENIEDGASFWLSDIVFNFNLDLKAAMNVIQRLVERGVLHD